MEASTIWHNKERSWVEKVQLPNSEGVLTIESIYSLISHGTEQTMLTQKLPPESIRHMRVPYMMGNLNDQFTYGYSLVGKVLEGSGTLTDKYVHLMHPHQDYALVSETSLFPVPEGMDLKLATLGSNMETAVNALWDSEAEVGDKILIAGYGLIGALIARLVQKIPGVTLEVMDMDPDRIRLFISHGFQEFKDRSSAGEFDIVFNTTGNEGVLQKAMRLTKVEGRIIELSWYGSKTIQLPLGADFHYGRKRIISSQVSNIPRRKQGDWDFMKRKELVFKLLGELDLSGLTDHVISFEDAPEFFGRLRKGLVKDLSTIIKY